MLIQNYNYKHCVHNIYDDRSCWEFIYNKIELFFLKFNINIFSFDVMECKNVVCILTFSWVFIFSNWISSSSKLLNFSWSWFEWIVNFFVLNKFYTCMRVEQFNLNWGWISFPRPNTVCNEQWLSEKKIFQL